MSVEDRAAAVAASLARHFGAPVRLIEAARLGGGAVQDNLALSVAVGGRRRDLVARMAPPATIAESRTLAEQFALLAAAQAAGVTVPEPVFLAEDGAFYVMARVEGVALGPRVARSGPHPEAARQLARELAAIHAIRPPRPDLAFLGAPPDNPAQAVIARARAWLDAAGSVRPALEWGMRRLERGAPTPGATVLAHRDFRTGNYMLAGERVAAVLDWEFAGWSDPHEDLGWFCAKCWRFGQLAREAGGIADRETFLGAYEEAADRRVDRAALAYWEAMAHLRWAIIALQQAHRHLSGVQPDLELALIYHRVPELEAELLAMTGNGGAPGPRRRVVFDAHSPKPYCG